MGRLNRQFCDPLRQYLFKLSVDSKDSKNKSLEVVYECSQCNHILFNKINVLFIDGFEDQIDCEYLFIEPIKWLTPKLCSSKKGDIRCPNCGTNLGKFKWKSFDCQCLLHNQLFDSKVIRINKNSVIRCTDK
jgi:hypothetical protein